MKTAASVLAMLFTLVSSLYGFVRAVIEVFHFNGTLAAYMLLLIPLAIVVFGLVGRLEHSVAQKLYSISIRHASYRLSNPSNGILHWIIPSNANKKISSLFLSQSVTLLRPV